ncbi:MAG TPA: ATP-grasp domain-containing protein [Vicinamibacterales bacterium]|jgi:biotin carboxylase|nr:ATP-grasp domain-containing protein [Vicinamibacterales bacterium]
MTRVLLLATTTGYQTRAFGEAAGRLGVELVYATDRCHVLDDPWRDQAIPVRFYDEAASAAAIVDAARVRPIDGVLVVGDRPTVIGAEVMRELGLPGHPPEAARVSRNKQLTRGRLRDAGLPVPWFISSPAGAGAAALARGISFPCVVKPLALSGSRGVIRADDEASFVAAWSRLQALLDAPDIRAERSDAHDRALIEGFIPGREYALEGVMHDGDLQVLALFDKPEPLDGPFFEETIYVTPSIAPAGEQAAIVEGIRRATAAIGLRHGPVHAECRVNDAGVFVLEVAARPIGGLCARALRFVYGGRVSVQYGNPSPVPLEELLLRHALGEPTAAWQREPDASGVMMIPIPRRGVLRRVSGVDDARAVPGIDDVQITAKADQRLVPLPEGASYLGFIFARGKTPAFVTRALQAAHARLHVHIDAELPIVGSR